MIKHFQHFKFDYELCIPDDTLYHYDTFKNTFYLGAKADINEDYFHWRQLSIAENPKILLGKNHPLANREHLSLAELKDETFYTLGSYNRSCHKYLIDLCHLSGFEPEHIVECDYYFRAKLIASGQGIGVSTDLGYMTNALANKSIIKIPLYGPSIQRTMVIAWKKETQLSPVAQLFLNYVLDYYKQRT